MLERLRERWINRSYRRQDEPGELTIQSTGRNATFRHGAQCGKPVRPCGCMPYYKDPNIGTRREFWATPHPNRRYRRRVARHARGLPVSR